MKKRIEIKRLSLPIPKGWEVTQHNLFEVDPKSPYPQEVIDEHLNAQLFQAACGDFLIDVGFYGYQYKQEGDFTVYLLRGDFYKGELLEKFRFPRLASVVQCLQQLMVQVTSEAYKELKGLKFGDDGAYNNYREYSVTGNKALKW